jgi:predicted nucleotidyltransferase component of viral defense system
MMERLLERVSISPYRDNLILKGGFLIAAMVGIDRRTTMDMDTTVKGLPVSRDGIENILSEIISLDADDGISFEIQDIKNIRDISEYDDFRVSLRAAFQTVRVNMKIDVTTGDAIIPREVEYHYRLMFEDRTIPVMAYNLYTILAEKIETILSRSVTNTRGRDFYDAYILLSVNKDTLLRAETLHALRVKAEERGSVNYIDNYSKHLQDIRCRMRQSVCLRHRQWVSLFCAPLHRWSRPYPIRLYLTAQARIRHSTDGRICVALR